MNALEALEKFKEARKGFYQGVVAYDDAVVAAEVYRDAVARLKQAEPSRFRRLAIPSIAKLMRG